MKHHRAMSRDVTTVQMSIHRQRPLARLGLMHLSAANLCLWLRHLVIEEMHTAHAVNHAGADPSGTLLAKL